MSEERAAPKPLAPWLSVLVLGVLSVAAVGAVIYWSPKRLLAAEFGVGLLAANVAFSRVGELSGKARLAITWLFAAANMLAVASACVVLSLEAPAWLIAMPSALLAPRRGLGGDRVALVYVVGLAVATAVGCTIAGSDLAPIVAAGLAVLAAGAAPLLSFGALEIRDELSVSQVALDEQRLARAAAEAGALRLKARLRDDSRRFKTEAELTAKFEQRFAAVEARHDQILAAIVDAVLTVNSEGTITSANPAAEGLFHAVRDQIEGWPLTRFLPTATPRLLDVIYRSSSNTDDTARATKTREVLCLRHDGSSIEVELGVGAFSGDGQIVGAQDEVFTIILRDISARKRVDRMKDELISTVSHELRTPLTAIIGSIGLLNGGASGPMPEAAGKLLSVAERNGQRLLTLIEDILDIQKMEAGKLEFSMQTTNLGAVVARAVETTRPMGQSRGVTYVFRAANGLPSAWADAGRIEQVVANLLSNATKHSPTGTTIEVVVDNPSIRRLRVQVRDEGPGLAESMMGRVFERFEQGDMGDTRQSGGTGLGLAIARAIVERHGGEIGVESELGVGANFDSEIPTAEAVGRGGRTPPPVTPISSKVV